MLWSATTRLTCPAAVTLICILGLLRANTAALQPPRNLTVLRVGTEEVTLAWLSSRSEEDKVLFYELTYELIEPPVGVFRVVQGVRPELRQVRVDNLRPRETYTVYMVSVDLDQLRSNISNEVVFTTTSDGVEPVPPTTYSPHAAEILIVVFVIIAWVVAVMVFLKRWASIRILQPMEPRYRHSPKNLENVKIVKRPQDSVIYKNYGRKLSVTIVEREKRRLQRMHTIATLPTIEMERVVTEM